MLDQKMRKALNPALDAGAQRIEHFGVGPGALTASGLIVGIGSCVAAGLEWWTLALVLWLTNRAIDGLDGPLARLHGATDLGGMLDFLADFAVYSGFPLGVAIAVPDARVAACALLSAYLLNNVALLSHSSLIEKRGLDLGDERSLRLTPGLTEGTETILCYSVVCLIPGRADVIFWAFTAMVMVTVAQRIRFAVVTLR